MLPLQDGSRQPAPRPGLGRALRSARALVACLLLSTCSTDSALAPGRVVESRLDVGFLFRAGGAVPIPVDTVLVELRRGSDSSIAYSARLPSSQFAQQSDSLIITIQLELRSSPEQFYFYAAAIGGGVTYYTVSGQVTAVANQSVSTPPLVPTYVGPGSTADSVRLTLSAAQVLAGDSVLATATVYDNNAAVSGVPVGIGTSDSSLVLPRARGVADAWLVAQPGATGGVTVTAVTATGLTFSLNLALGSPTTGPATVTALSPTAVTGIVNQLVGQAPRVEVRDSTNAPAAGVTVTFAAAAGNGTVTGGTQVTNGSGIATVGGWRLAQAVGTNTLTATVTGLPPVQFTATGGPTAIAVLARDSGDAQSDTAGRTLAQQLVVQARDTFANLIPGLTVNWTATDGTIAPASGATDAQGRARTSWTLGFLQASPTATATAGGVQAIFSATTFFTQPTIQLNFSTIPGVGIGLSSVVRVQLNQPAPAGGTLVSVVSGNTSLFTVAPASVTIPQGQTTDSVTITGLSAGTALLTASATGYTSGTISVDVQNRNVSVPVTLNVPYGQTASLPIQLPAPAPAGGVTFAVVSSAPTVVGIQTAQVTIGAGLVAANATVQGLLPGTATVTVSNPAYNSANSTVNSTAALNLLQGSATLNTSFGDTVDIRFESNAQPIAAPSPGVSIVPVITNPQCLVATPSPATIVTGQTTVSLTLSYGGGATLPCTTQLKVTAANIQPDSINVTVNPTPPITLSPSFTQIGSGLSEGINIGLGASNHGGVTLTVKSENTAVGLIAPSTTGAGTDSVQVFIPNGSSSTFLYMQALPGQTGSFSYTASATGFVPDTITVSAVTPGFQIEGFPGATTSLSTDSPFYVTVGVPNGQLTGLSRYQNLRGGGTPLTATFTNQVPSVGTLVTSAQGAGSPRTALVQPGLYYTPTSVATGGVAFRPAGAAGQDTVTATIAGFTPMSSLVPRVITVSLPTSDVSVGFTSVGSGLQESGFLSLGASNHGGRTGTVKSLDPTRFLVAPNTATAGTDSILIAFPNGQTSSSFTVQALEGQTDSTYILFTVPGFTPDSQLVRAVQPGMQIEGLGTAYATATGVVNFYTTIGVPNGPLTGLSRYQNLRVGGPGPVSVTFTSSDTTIGTLVVTGDSGSPQVAQIQPQLYYTPTSVSSGGVGFLPLSGGNVSVNATASGFLPMSSTTPRTITVSQPTSSVGAFFSQIGSGLQEGGSASLSASQHGGVTMVIKSLNPAAALLAPNASTAGSDSLVVNLANGQGSTSFMIQALEGFTGFDTITVSVPGFAPDTAVVQVVTPGIQIEALPAATTTLSPNSQFYATIGVPNAQGTGLSRYQNRRPGGPGPVTVTFTSNPASVAALVDSLGSAATRTAQIVGGVYYTPTSVSTGGVALDPLLGGTTQVSAAATGFTAMTNSNPFTVTVSQPGMSVSTNFASVGSGLMESGSISLGASQHNGVTVTLTSSDPSLVLVSPNTSTAGTGSIQLAIPNGQTSASFTVHGLEGVTGSVALTAVAPGFTNGNGGIAVVVPGIQLEGVSTTVTTLDADNQIYATVGIPNANNTGLSRYQNVRAASAGISVTFGSSDTSRVRLVSLAGGPGTPQSATITSGVYYTPTSFNQGGIAARPVAVGTATLSVSAGGTIQQTAGLRPQTVVMPVIALSAGTVGAGLQLSASVDLGAAQHGGDTLTIRSTTPGVLLVSPNSTTAGADSIQIVVNNGTRFVNFYIQGVEDQAGTINLIARVDARFVDDTLAVPVVQPGIEIQNLSLSQTAGGADNAFYVQVGIPNGFGTALSQVQNVRFGGPGSLIANLTSSSPGVGAFVDQAGGPGSPRNVSIPSGQYYSPTSIATGGIGFRPLLAGQTTVSAASTGLASMTTTGVRLVTVN